VKTNSGDLSSKKGKRIRKNLEKPGGLWGYKPVYEEEIEREDERTRDITRVGSR
jgi:hypothetical protein